MAKLTGAACRAGRALLKWSVRDLADAAGVATGTIVSVEDDAPTVRESSREKIKAAFAARGVEITNGDGTGARLLAEIPR